MPLITVAPKVGKRAPVGSLRPPQQPPTLDPEPEPDNQPPGSRRGVTSGRSGAFRPFHPGLRGG